MNPGQEKFLDFIVKMVKDEYKDTVKELMTENFKKQDDGTFSHEDMVDTQGKLMKMLKPESVEEVKQAMQHFASQMK